MTNISYLCHSYNTQIQKPMKTRIALLTLCLVSATWCSLPFYGQDNSEAVQTRVWIPSKPMVITVETPGTLSKQFTDKDLDDNYEVCSGFRNCKIIGYLNSDDLRFLHKVKNSRIEESFHHLDLSECHIVKGGGPYYTHAKVNYYIKEDDVLEAFSLPLAINLKLPNSLKKWNMTWIMNGQEKGTVWCQNLTIGDSLREFSPKYPEYGLVNIHVSANNPYLSSLDGVLFNKDKSRLITYPCYATRTSYSVPEGVREIGNYAFCKAEYLKDIDIPEGVISIGDKAFWGAKNVCFKNTFSLSNPIALDWLPYSLEHIGDSAFVFTGHGIVILPPYVKSIGQDAFEHWHNGHSSWIVDIEDLEDNIMYCASPTPPVCMPNKFGVGPFCWIGWSYDILEHYVMDYRHTRLYVPVGSKPAYENAFGWGYDYFEEIIEVEDVMAAAEEAVVTNIREQKMKDRYVWEVSRYDLQGKRLQKPTKGVNIIRYSDGSTRKEYVK